MSRFNSRTSAREATERLKGRVLRVPGRFGGTDPIRVTWVRWLGSNLEVEGRNLIYVGDGETDEYIEVEGRTGAETHSEALLRDCLFDDCTPVWGNKA